MMEFGIALKEKKFKSVMKKKNVLRKLKKIHKTKNIIYNILHDFSNRKQNRKYIKQITENVICFFTQRNDKKSSVMRFVTQSDGCLFCL